MITAIVSSEGQIEIPRALRDRLNFGEGTEVLLDVQGDALIMKRATEELSDWRTMRGMLRNAVLLRDLITEREADLDRDASRINQSRCFLGNPFVVARPECRAPSPNIS